MANTSRTIANVKRSHSSFIHLFAGAVSGKDDERRYCKKKLNRLCH
jgi:hypothetical protein